MSDIEILNTLKRIEGLLKKAAPTTGATAGSRDRSDESEKRSNQRDLANQRKIFIATSTSLHRIGSAAEGSAKSLDHLSKKARVGADNLEVFAGALGKTVTRFTNARSELSKIQISGMMNSLQKAVDDAASSIANVQIGAGVKLDNLIAYDSLLKRRTIPQTGRFGKALVRSTSLLSQYNDRIGSVLQKVGQSQKEFGKNIASATTAIDRRDGVATQFDRLASITKAVNTELRKLRVGIRRGSWRNIPSGEPSVRAHHGRGRHIDTDDENSSSPKSFKGKMLAIAGSAISSSAKNLAQGFGRSIAGILDEMFATTASRGYGTTDNYKELSIDAMKAGMSLAEFAELMDRNMGVVSRMSSFNEFDKALGVGRDALKKFGVFGHDATVLASSIMGASQTLGAPVKDSSKAIEGQVAVFEELRRTTGITAGQFAEFQATMQDSDTVQRDMLSLNEDQRIARQKDIMQSLTFGKALGMSTQQANALGHAMIDLRKNTVKQRFEIKGRVAQAFGIAGMSMQDTARASQLFGKVNRTSAENKELADIVGRYEKLKEQKIASADEGNIGGAYQIETADELLGGLIGQFKDAAKNMQLAKESGDQIIKDTNKQPGAIEQVFGQTVSFIEGIEKSALGRAILGGMASLSLLAVQSITLRQILAAIKAGGLAGGLGEAASKSGVLGKVAGGIRNKVADAALAASMFFGSYNPTGAPYTEPSHVLSTIPAKTAPVPGLPSTSPIAGAGVPYATTYKGLSPTPTTVPPTSAAGAATATASTAGAAGKAGWMSKLGSIGKIGGGVIGGALGIFSAATEYMNAEETAKRENGGDGDVGKAKGEAIGDGIGSAAGAAIGAALAPFTAGLSLIAGPLLGGFIGKWLGGLAGSESATEKQTRATKENTDAIVKSRQTMAGEAVMSSANMGMFSDNAAKTAMAYASATDSERAKAAKDAGVSAATAVAAPMAEAARKTTDAVNSQVPFGMDASQAFATEAATTPKAVNSKDINNTSEGQQAVSEKARILQTTAAIQPSSNTEVLNNILAVLQELLKVEKDQLDAANQLARVNGPRIPDGQILTRRVYSQ